MIDITTRAFERLPSTFGARAIRGDGTDEDVLRRAGAEGADMFLALTEGDNRNIMSAQLAAEALGVGRVIAKINDPVRAAGVRRTRHRHALPDRADGRCHERLPRLPAVGPGRHAGPDRASSAAARPSEAPRSRARMTPATRRRRVDPTSPIPGSTLRLSAAREA